MYEEQNNYRVGINWKDIIIKLILLVLFVVLLLWLLPSTPQLDTFYDRVFNENIQTMKEAAKSYYTTDRLPINVGESATMTLQEMQDNHLVLPFVDKNNETCSLTNSFVQVTKTGEYEYVLKVQLSCGSQTDYILDTIGCYDNCPAGECVMPDDEEEEVKNPVVTPSTPTQKITQYQFKKEVINTSTTYTCPVGYTRNGKECSKVVDSDRINATLLYGKDQEIVTNAIPVTSGGGVEYVAATKTQSGVEYTCPQGYVREGSNCYLYTSSSQVTGDAVYTCPQGYVSNGSYCYLYTAATEVGGQDIYTCPAGYTEYGSTCYKTTSGTKVEAGSSCPSGYSEDAFGRCYKKTAATTTSGSKTCPSGYQPNGSNCVKVQNAKQTTSSSWVHKNTNTYTYAVKEYETATEKRVLTNKVYKATCNGCFTYSWYYTYVTYYKPVSYTCTGVGGTLNGDKCYSYKEYTTTSGSKTCTVGTLNTTDGYCYQYTSKVSSGTDKTICPTNYEYNAVDGKCYRYANKIKETTPGTTVCPTGYSKDSSGKCYKRVAADVSYGTTTVCPTGYSKDSLGRCYKSVGASVENEYKYSCPNGYTQAGSGESTVCYKVGQTSVTYKCENSDEVLKGDKCIKTIKGSELGYSCPTGYYVRDTKYCVKTEKQTIAATAKTSETVSYKYTWSNNKTLDGWVATGKTRQVNA